MASDMFLKLGDIRGESTDEAHRDEIEVLAFTWNVQPGAMAVAGGGSSSKARRQHAPIVIRKRIDKSSPLLMKACATQENLNEARLTVRKAGKGLKDHVVFTMSGVIVTSVSLSGTNEDSANFTESVTLECEKADLEYKP